jgi:hypothetical protein
MKPKRNLSGIWFSVIREGKACNICFEDLTDYEQLVIIKRGKKEYIGSLAQKLADVLNEIGEKYNIEKR